MCQTLRNTEAHAQSVRCRELKANSHTQCRSNAAPMPFPRHAMPCRVNSHMPCRTPTILIQRRVLRESPRGSRKYPNFASYSLTYWYASDKKLRGTPRGSRKKPNAGRSPTCCLWTANADSNIPCHDHVTPMPRFAMALRSRFQNGGQNNSSAENIRHVTDIAICSDSQ
jgi:hypothetical protein